MEIEFVDPAEVPLPPDEVSFRSLEVEPYPDGTRLKVSLSVTPFQERPSIEIEVRAEGATLASSSIVEATDTDMSLTLHLRAPAPQSQLLLTGSILYREYGEVDRREITFSLPEK